MATGKENNEIAEHILSIADITQEPLEFLAPISGYAKMPLVSLEEAVKPLVPTVSDVQSRAYVAKQRCEKPADGLSPDESASIMLYTMGGGPQNECLYAILNATLRLSSTDREEKLEPWYLYLRLFLNAPFRLPPHRATVYRGVKLDMRAKYTVGKTSVWWGFSSCTTAVEVLQSKLFLGKIGHRTLFLVQCETARDITKHSFYPGESEFLLLAATQFEVTGCLDQDELHIIQLKETRPPHPLLQPVPNICQSRITPSSGTKIKRSFVDGMTGVVTKPVSGAKQKGASGFVKGLGKDFFGLVTRSTGDIVDFASTSLDIIKRTAQQEEIVRRVRYPRHVGRDGLVRPYIAHEAMGF